MLEKNIIFRKPFETFTSDSDYKTKYIHPDLDKVRKKSLEFQDKNHEVDFASSPFQNMKRSIDWYPSNELFFVWSWTLNSSSIAKRPILLYRDLGV